MPVQKNYHLMSGGAAKWHHCVENWSSKGVEVKTCCKFKNNFSLETLTSFFHNENMTGFSYISSNHPSVLGYTHSTLLHLAKVPLHLLRCCNCLILVMRKALVRSHCLLSKTRERDTNQNIWALRTETIRNKRVLIEATTRSRSMVQSRKIKLLG